MNTNKNSIFIDYIEYGIQAVKEGGMGQVLILDRLTKRTGIDRIHRPRIAAKLIKTSDFSAETCAQFERELNIWITLEHPRIAPLLKIVRVNGSLLALMPYCSNNLRELISEAGVFQKSTALLVITQIIEALHYAHDTFKIVHLDIKPENVLVEPSMSDKVSYLVSDWGIANIQDVWFNKNKIGDYLSCITETYNNFGTLPYMAPERLLGSVPSNIASDIYGVGMILYEMLFGQLPFDFNNSNPLQNQIVNAHYMDHAIIKLKKLNDNRLAQFILNCIHPDIRARYNNYDILQKELKKIGKPIRSFFRL